jgi:hypothetical protein
MEDDFRTWKIEQITTWAEALMVDDEAFVPKMLLALLTETRLFEVRISWRNWAIRGKWGSKVVLFFIRFTFSNKF